VANPSRKAIILLAINGGIGNSDIGNLLFSDIDLVSGWIDCPRPKTGLPRRIPLWNETVSALKYWPAPQKLIHVL
jgi:integrase